LLDVCKHAAMREHGPLGHARSTPGVLQKGQVVGGAAFGLEGLPPNTL
jgi:hypothetical protein